MKSHVSNSSHYRHSLSRNLQKRFLQRSTEIQITAFNYLTFCITTIFPTKRTLFKRGNVTNSRELIQLIQKIKQILFNCAYLLAASKHLIVFVKHFPTIDSHDRLSVEKPAAQLLFFFFFFNIFKVLHDLWQQIAHL